MSIHTQKQHFTICLLCEKYSRFVYETKAFNFCASKQLHRALCCLFRPDTACFKMRTEHCAACSDQTQTCIKMRTALPANTKTRPNVVSMLVQRHWGGPILKQHWVKCSRLLGSTQVSVYTHPSAIMIFLPAAQGTFSKTAGQSQAYYNT